MFSPPSVIDGFAKLANHHLLIILLPRPITPHLHSTLPTQIGPTPQRLIYRALIYGNLVDVAVACNDRESTPILSSDCFSSSSSSFVQLALGRGMLRHDRSKTQLQSCLSILFTLSTIKIISYTTYLILLLPFLAPYYQSTPIPILQFRPEHIIERLVIRLSVNRRESPHFYLTFLLPLALVSSTSARAHQFFNPLLHTILLVTTF